MDGIETKIDHIKEISKTVTSILQEVISLKATIKLQKSTIGNLTNEKNQLIKDLEDSITKLSYINKENTRLSEEKKEVELINKENSDYINQLKTERRVLVHQLADL